MGAPNRELLRDLLRKWAQGRLSERQVHDEAEKLWNSEVWAYVSEADDRSIAIEVLSQLDAMNHQLVIKDDIPAMGDFLNTPLGSSLQGWKSWKKYWASLNFDSRRRELAENKFYIV